MIDKSEELDNFINLVKSQLELSGKASELKEIIRRDVLEAISLPRCDMSFDDVKLKTIQQEEQYDSLLMIMIQDYLEKRGLNL
ncbi:hypothetical protein HZS_3761, partial [Henneguya salminicola]